MKIFRTKMIRVNCLVNGVQKKLIATITIIYMVAIIILLAYVNLGSYLILKENENLISYHEFEQYSPNEISWWDETSLVHCNKFLSNSVPPSNLEAETMREVGGHCGARAYSRGPNQLVISFGIFGDNMDYWKGLDTILTKASEIYPGYVVRLHTNPRGKESILCPLLVKFKDNLDICDIMHLPKPLKSVNYLNNKRLWRLSPFGDPQVTRILVRDSNSYVSIYWREMVIIVMRRTMRYYTAQTILISKCIY